MKKRISYIAPLQFGIVLATLYGLLSLIFVPFVLLFTLFGARHGSHGSVLGSAIAVIFLPVLYVILGFIGGVIVAAIYNVIAGWTGGIELTLTDVDGALPPLPSQPGQPS